MLFALVLGVTLGLVPAMSAARSTRVIMRIADVQLTFPAILIALLIDGVARGVLLARARTTSSRSTC